MGFSKTAHEGNRFRFQIKDSPNEAIVKSHDGNEDKNPMDSVPAVVDILCLLDTHHGNIGAGTVHHVAWRTPTDESQLEMRSRIIKTRLNATPVIDRTYFLSVYFREPGGVLFEIATDPPGFLIDQKPEELGQKLALPTRLEPRRGYLEKTLPSINITNHDNNNAAKENWRG